MRRRSPAVTALLAVVALVLLPALSNVEANALPTSWAPLLWIAWPAGLLLAVPLVYLEIRRHHRPEQAAETDAAARRLDHAVTDLAAAVTRQWTDELARRSVHRGAALRVRWQNTARQVARHLADVLREELVDQVTAVSGDTAGQLVTVLDSLRDGQVVVLGEPGAGKTVLAVQFALQVLEHRGTDDPVPVLLTLSSWNPAAESLRTWLARRILEDYPALGNAQVYGGNATTELVTGDRILAVLDGLDEMPAAARRSAVVALDHAAGTGFPMVVTCRRQEYEDAVTRDGVFLGRAAVLEMLPVEPADARRYLLAAAPADASPWPPVLDRLDARPYTPLARVLASPLMIALARTVYAAPASSPRELLNRKRFRKQEQIERHLLDEFINVTYRDTPVLPETTSTPRYPPERARQWLTVLARYLRDQETGDLAWWRLLDTVPRTGRALVAGVTIGLVFGLADALASGVVIGLTFGPTKGLALGLLSGTADGLVYGLIGALIAGLGRPHRPTRVQLRFDGTLRSFLSRFAASCGMSVALALAAGMHVVPAIGIGMVVGLAFAAQVWLDAPGDATETPTPRIALRQNRTAALGFGLTLAVGFGAFEGMNYLLGAAQSIAATGALRLFLILAVALAASGCVGYVLYGWIGCAVVGLIEVTVTGYVLAGSASGRLIGVTFVPFAGLPVPSDGTVGTLFGITFGLTVGVAGVVSRAWGNFCLVRVWLALRGYLPWRLMRFLDDAHRRGVLRQTGAVYQFRHARLQDQLANTMDRAPECGRRSSAARVGLSGVDSVGDRAHGNR